MDYQVKIVKPEKMVKYRNKWNALALCMKHPSIFCTWEWMSLWWKYFGHLYKPLLLFIEEETEIAGILPLAIRNMVVEDGLIPIRTITLWSSMDLFADHLDIIASPEKAHSCINAAIFFLHNNYTNWDIMHLSHIDEDSNLLNFILKENHTLKFDTRKVSIAPYINIYRDHKGSIENYLKSLGRNKRHDLKRREKLLFDEAGIAYGPPNLPDTKAAIDRLFALHNMRTKKKKLKSSFTGLKLKSFHTEVAEVFVQKGWLCLRFLYRGNEQIAALYCFDFANCLFAYQSGHDPQWESKGVGSLILYKVIREAFNEKKIEFDFLRGGERYKNTWTKASRDQFDVYIYSGTFRSIFFKTIYKGRTVLKRILRDDKS